MVLHILVNRFIVGILASLFALLHLNASQLWSHFFITFQPPDRPADVTSEAAETLGAGHKHSEVPEARVFPLSTADHFDRPCVTPSSKKWPYCNAYLSDEERISFLLDTLTMEEKISMLGNQVPAISRLSLPAYNWWSEALHGVASSCCPGMRYKSTSFPQVCTTGASFNRSLFAAIGDAIGTEAVEHYWTLNDVQGLTYWTPNVNLFRDPRWGRGQEVPGEDPFLNGEYAAAFIPALQYGIDGQGRGGGLPRVAAACKHFAAYSLETGRMAFDAQVDDIDMNESYLPMFKVCADVGALGFMCSYNAVNGVPSCANADLMTNKLRSEWNFDGYITTDCGALENIYAAHKYTDSLEEAIGVSLKAGVDTDCGDGIANHGVSAVKNGKLSINDVDRALRNLFSVQLRLGYFNPPSVDEHSRYLRRHLSKNDLHMHDELALEAAREGIVLLKNRQDALPLDPLKQAKISLFGPNADATFTMQGNYFGQAPFLISPKDGLEAIAESVAYFKGCNITSEGSRDSMNSDEICAAAAGADASILIMGLNQQVESEGRDRTSLSFPPVQADLISLVKSCAKKDADKPVVLVVMSGGPVDLGPYKDDSDVDSILYVGYPGQAGGTAIADALYGKFSPSGRLTTTIYPQSFADSVGIKDMRMRPSSSDGYPGRTHRYYSGDVVYPFGYGLSYSTFDANVLSDKHDPTRVYVEVGNQGPMPASHSILLFHSSPLAGINDNPIETLVGFEKIHLDVGQTTKVEFRIDDEMFLKEAGRHKFFLGRDGKDAQAMAELAVHVP